MSPLPRAKQFYFTHEKKAFFFLEIHTTFLRTLTPVLKYSRQRLLLFSSINLLVCFQAKACYNWIWISLLTLFPFCYRLVKTYVREHISVFNKNDRRNLFISTYHFSVGMLLTKHRNGWKFCGIIWYEQYFGKYVQAIKLIKTISFVCLLASHFSHKILRVQKFCQKAIKQHRL